MRIVTDAHAPSYGYCRHPPFLDPGYAPGDGSSSEVLVGVVSTGVGSRSVAAAVDKRLTGATPVDCGWSVTS